MLDENGCDFTAAPVIARWRAVKAAARTAA